MTEPGSIQAYLDTLRRTLGRADAERFLVETHDHLLESVAAGLERGLSSELADARALELFGPPEQVARQYAAELAEAMWEKRMLRLRFVALAFALLTLYYARFFLAVRQEAATLVQIGILLAAAVVLVLPARFTPGGAAWLRGKLPVSVRLWATAVVALGLAVTVFAWADHDSHSVSDTLNRFVPTLCLILAVVLRIAYQSDPSHTAARQ